MRGFGLIDWWAGQSPGLRFGVAAVLLLVSAACGFGTWRADSARPPDQATPRRIQRGYQLAVGVGALGLVLLAFGGRSEAEKKGYHDF